MGYHISKKNKLNIFKRQETKETLDFKKDCIPEFVDPDDKLNDTAPVAVIRAETGKDWMGIAPTQGIKVVFERILEALTERDLDSFHISYEKNHLTVCGVKDGEEHKEIIVF